MLLLPEVWQEKPSGQPPETRVVRTVTRFGGMVRNAIQWLVSCANPWYGMARAVTADIISALRWSSGLAQIPNGYLTRFDVAADGRITIADAARISRKVVGAEANP